MAVVLVGPTAVGKSSLAIALAQHYRAAGRPAEVVSADSMLVYRGMDIGTAKPTLTERAAVVHHLIDIFDVRRSATVAEFQAMARRVIADCEARGVVPIVVGGSALYIRAIVDDFQFPGTDPGVRARWESALEELGPEGLHRRLADLDPEAAAQLLPGNSRRVVRALEVIELTGRPYRRPAPRHRYVLPGVVQIGLDIDRPSLDARIEQRVEAMWRPDWWRRYATLAGAWSARRADGLPRPRLSTGAELSGRRDHRGTGVRADGDRHPQVRSAAGCLVPEGSADQLAALRPIRTWSPRRTRSPDRTARGGNRRWKTEPVRRWTFTKGHGTGNDFVLLVDREAMIDLSAADVRFLCDRHTGIGADGVLRAVFAKHIDGWTGDGSLWFMDYRNADGSVAEMCGNGVRVFVRFLIEESLASGPVVQVATRAGVKEATVLPDGQIRVAMGPVSVGGPATTVTTADGAEFSALEPTSAIPTRSASPTT